MPRYYFDICDSRGQVQDEEGTECADLEAALREAECSARDLVSSMWIAIGLSRAATSPSAMSGVRSK